ncbi:TonB-dependent receptor [Novosphingobium sp. EMRT-2]|uniref:TonB-dependent receptor domain-containing protein n=1 Tax=Novosphingobium sp. EMRT-2 TaxID=2571749 RepID=UPI0021048B6B|nr:TonB-dependent receptor [Novosphingobium sp. EMRT-2]
MNVSRSLAELGLITYHTERDTLQFQTGLRGPLTASTKWNIYAQYSRVPASLAPLNGLSREFSGSRVDYRLGAQYHLTDAIMGYAQFSTGFKGGGINPRPFFPAQALPHNPETLKAYEIGLKSEFLDHRVRLNASAFINKYNDILVTVSNCPVAVGVPAAPCALPLNAGKATIKGFEAELAVRPVQGLSIDASLAYLHFKYDSISAIAASAGIGLEDKGVYISPWQWSLGAQYEFDLGKAARSFRASTSTTRTRSSAMPTTSMPRPAARTSSA